MSLKKNFKSEFGEEELEIFMSEIFFYWQMKHDFELVLEANYCMLASYNMAKFSLFLSFIVLNCKNLESRKIFLLYLAPGDN